LLICTTALGKLQVLGVLLHCARLLLHQVEEVGDGLQGIVNLMDDGRHESSEGDELLIIPQNFGGAIQFNPGALLPCILAILPQNSHHYRGQAAGLREMDVVEDAVAEGLHLLALLAVTSDEDYGDGIRTAPSSLFLRGLEDIGEIQTGKAGCGTQDKADIIGLKRAEKFVRGGDGIDLDRHTLAADAGAHGVRRSQVVGQQYDGRNGMFVRHREYPIPLKDCSELQQPSR
jgi:hypothetical protein